MSYKPIIVFLISFVFNINCSENTFYEKIIPFTLATVHKYLQYPCVIYWNLDLQTNRKYKLFLILQYYNRG